ncbi:MAG: TPR repeat-containing protein YrrB [candidate division TA06 bacterium ADurb.Bin417]|uniref:TPR repeat-containing protein YrrB n=1 Tax=candidate division TA06 bacterium ADurb.Bin417 TaxID=1852828 RepID=A0A1V5MDH4_UNCT6|nr:MAG: TPR repeat-containing protein YrrB [candidate division TA06 bacterium ADurb.Bin417]
MYDYRVSRSLLDPPLTLAGLLLAAGLLLLGVLLYRRRFRLEAFAIFWFFLALSVESSFIPLQDVIFEHRLYLPLFGFALLLPALLFHLAGKRPAGLRTATGFLLLVSLVFGGLAFARNRVWRTELSLWSDAARKSPRSTRALLKLAEAYDAQGSYALAVEINSRIIRYQPRLAEAYLNRAVAYKKLGEAEAALRDLDRALEIRPAYPGAYFNRAIIRRTRGDRKSARADLDRALEIQPAFPAAAYWRGLIYLEEGAADSALADFNRAVAIQPDHLPALFQRGRLLLRKRDFERAAADFSLVLKHDPGHVPAYNQRAIALAGAGRTEAAIADWREALRRKPDFGEAGFNLALTYYLMGDYARARECVRNLEAIRYPVPAAFLRDLQKVAD